MKTLLQSELAMEVDPSEWPDSIKQELTRERAPRYLWITLPDPIQQNGRDFSYVVQPFKPPTELAGKTRLNPFGSGFLCETETEAKETAAELSEKIKEAVTAIQSAGWTEVQFVARHIQEAECEVITAFDDAGKICFLRHKWNRPATESGFSKEHHVGVAHIPSVGISGVVTITDVRNGQLIEVKHFTEPKELRSFGCKVSYEAFVYCGEKSERNLDETFCFVTTPPHIPSNATRDETGTAFLNFVLAVLREEHRKDQLRSAALEQERLKLRPARLDHEQPDMNHYANQQQVVEKLLRKEWRLLFEAMDKGKRPQTENEKTESKKEIWLSYIADHKALFGKIPEVRQAEALEILKDDNFHSLLNQAMSAPGAQVDKRDWQLAIGWIVKNYYRMKEAELEKAFANDWNYKAGQHKGNTLAKRAREMGLVSARQRGRPENPNSLPPG